MSWHTVRPNERKSHYWYCRSFLEHGCDHGWRASLCGMGKYQGHLVPETEESKRDRCKRCESILNKEVQS